MNNKYFIYVGNAYPHKNLPRLIRAVVLLNAGRKKKVVLKIGCARSVFLDRLETEIKRQNAQNLVEILGFIPEEKISGVYKNSVAFVFPTLSEGFGLPPMEAINAGTLTVVSNIPVLKEVYQDSVFYFDPLSTRSITEKLAEVLNISDSERKKKILYAQKFVKDILGLKWRMRHSQSTRKVAIVYDRANKWGGAERVLLTLHEMFPEAPLYTSVYDAKRASWAMVFPEIHTSFLQKIPLAKNAHEFLGTLMPLVFETFNFDEYDTVVSVTSEAAIGIITKPGTLHICYCLTPTRYLWSGYNEYFKGVTFKAVAKPFVNYLRKWGKIAANRPDVMIAISTEVRNRIEKYYGRKSQVIYPPCVTSLYNDVTGEGRVGSGGRYYLAVGRLVGYKKTDLLVKAFNKLGSQLIIIGDGWQKWKLKLMAGKNIKFVYKASDKELLEYYKNAKALVMPQEEDFGMVAVEAQAAGTPVIAFRRGGAKDTVIDGKTGVLFDKQSVESLVDAIRRFEKIKFVVDNLCINADRFSKDKFKSQLTKHIK